MPDLLPVTLDDMIQEVERELEMRSRVYDRYKHTTGLIKRKQMDRQYEVMEAILKRLEGERDAER